MVASQPGSAAGLGRWSSWSASCSQTFRPTSLASALLSRCLRDPGIPLDVRTARALLLLDGQFPLYDVAREALEVVRSELGQAIGPDHIWVIGDTPLDIQCARCIGARLR